MPATLSRRDMLAGLSAGIVVAASSGRTAALSETVPIFATAYRDRAGHGVALLGEDGRLLANLPLPDRGHDVVRDPASNLAVAFARRPGEFALVFDIALRKPVLTIPSAPGRHFFGHGVFAPDGGLLYATENDYDAAAGMIGVYEVSSGFRRVDEFPTHGMDPHDLLLAPDGETLVIANGGIETHPDFGRAKLNLATMDPSLVFVDRQSGNLLERHRLPPRLHQLSIRHLDVDADGTVWFGCQHEGPASETPQLLGTARRGRELRLIGLPEQSLLGMRNYVGSVAANHRAGTVAITSPQGNSALVVDCRSLSVVASRSLPEVCGVAPSGDGFLMTTGTGGIVAPDIGATAPADIAWDNHVLRLG